MDRLKLFTGRSHPELGNRIGEELGVEPSKIDLYNYRTGCFEVVLRENMRGCHVFLLQTSVPDEWQLHWDLFQLFQMVNAAQKGSAGEITVIMPHNAYGLSDKKWTGRMPIAGKILVTCLEVLGMKRFLGLDFHSSQFEGFFDAKTPVDHLRAYPLLAEELKKRDSKEDSIILPGDEGFHKKAEELGDNLGLPVGSVEKTRLADDTVLIKSIKGDVKGKKVLICDDLICSGGTLRAVVDKVEEMGAKEASLVSVHASLNEKSVENLKTNFIKEIITTDTVPISKQIQEKISSLRIFTTAPFLGEAIKEIYEAGSVSKLFKIPPPVKLKPLE